VTGVCTIGISDIQSTGRLTHAISDSEIIAKGKSPNSDPAAVNSFCPLRPSLQIIFRPVYFTTFHRVHFLCFNLCPIFSGKNITTQ
jgi:hypothetical protein